MKRYLTLSKGIRNFKALETFLGGRVDYGWPKSLRFKVLTWGRKIEADRGEQLSRITGRGLIRLEDGFFAYQLHPSLGSPRLSLIADPVGIYYDASRPSQLEDLLNQSAGLNREQLARTKGILATIKEEALSKYNHQSLCRDQDLDQAHDRKRILIVDQTFGDRSVYYSGASAQDFKAMVAAAVRENPEAQIFAKIHPDVKLGTKKGYLKDFLPDNVTLIDRDLNPVYLLGQVDHVYTVSSQVGFEALLLGKSVTCFGVPFYAGWGLTDDRRTCERRKNKLSIEQLAYHTLVDYCLYVDPVKDCLCEIEDTLDLLKQKEPMKIRHYDKIYALGLSFWKRCFMPFYLRPHVKKLRFIRQVKSLSRATSGAAVLVWGYQHEKDVALARSKGYQILRIEDGFIRSVGLGTDLKRPSSLVIEEQELYYHGSKESRLESILARQTFSPSILQRAEKLIETIKQSKVTKYNVGAQDDVLFTRGEHDSRTVRLVVGQVPGDASLKLGGVDCFGDAGLLRFVRDQFPDSFIVYKPHPDTISGNRSKASVPENLYDVMLVNQSIIKCFAACDAVHVLTSLAGFEALIHGKQVFTYGMPFYAGWGLTIDRHQRKERSRDLSLAELVAGTLIFYPHYFSWSKRAVSSVESIIDEIRTDMEKNVTQNQKSGINRWWTKLRYFKEALLY
ncbi:capsular polysaccharide biosynthesis protein [Pseudobacteriovorax antillogorgiicola]|uniref:Capsular polysaccharide export protein n=1 Tax=Pseudobacteriovorax antillogorgiicola TaxID=1513793 RepID=A0A1Y6C726_9BACT|nr:capsular polysaccharide biosynthesis protein [Pseudobacteriovorax antillogorgiicola]TCS50632.1 capsular polysaccharide export protein [Pseudobacteriovorax antillogorgiicola]SMF39493.1 capsular polysaccharide export protein [Pseudobacteriovorax antillogorgiicola]